MKSRPRATSKAALSAPMNGIESRPVSTVPPTSPFLRIEPAIVKIAIAPPIHGIDLDNRRAALAPPQLTRFLVTLPILQVYGPDGRRVLPYVFPAIISTRRFFWRPAGSSEPSGLVLGATGFFAAKPRVVKLSPFSPSFSTSH